MKEKNKYALLLSEKEHISYSEAYAEMRSVNQTTGLPFSDYYSNDLHSLEPSSRFRKAKKLSAEKAERDLFVEEIGKELNMGVDEVRAMIKAANDRYAGAYSLKTTVYHDYEFYRMTEAEQDRTVELLSKRIKLRKQFKDIYYDSADISERIGELEKLYEEVKDINRVLMTETLKNRYKEIFSFRYPEIISDDRILSDVVLDFLTLHGTGGHSDVDYKLYDLFPKSLSEKLSFVPRLEMTRLIKAFNSPNVRYVFDDKFSCYRKFSKYYKRKVVSVKSIRDSLRLALFCRKNPKFVKKPVFALAGAGIGVVDAADFGSIRDMVSSILSEDGEFVAEELVQGHPSTAVFNKDSLNTLRIVTFNAGEKVDALDENSEAFRRGLISNAGNGIYCCAPFFKTGRKGFVVDNAGAGGVFSAVSLNDGSGSAIACGENGIDHDVHPDSGVRFDSIQFDSINNAIELSAELALQIPEARIIGWDFALNEKGEWVLIEANYAPTLIGQAPARLGIHSEICLLSHFM